MPTDHIITLRHNLLSGLLEECQALCDLTIVCRDGKLQCNSLLLFATFRGIDDIFKTVHENTVIIIPDVDIQFLEDFLENVYNQNEIIEPHPSITFLLKRNKGNRSIEGEGNAEDGIFETFSFKNKTEQDSCEVADFDSLDAIQNSEEDTKGEPIHDEKPVTIPLLKKERRKGRENKDKSVEPRIHPILRFPYTDFYCQVCDLTIGGSSNVLANENKLFSHVYFNHGPFPERKCPDCDEYLHSPKSLDNHRRREHVEKLPCPDCGKLVYTYKMRQHVINYHEKLQCEQCLRKFPNKYFLSKHISIVHEKVSIPRQSWKMEERCDRECKCGIEFPTLKAKLSHFKLVHLGYTICPTCKELIKHENDAHLCNPDRQKEYRRKNCEKEQVCKECGKSFETAHKLVYHRENVHKAEECSCELCGKVFFNKYKLAAHLRKVNHSGKTPCPMCGVLVLNMKRHMKNAHR